MCPHYWPSIDHALWWMQVEVSGVPCYKVSFRVSPLSVGRIICRETQSLGRLDTPSPVPATATGHASTSMVNAANWDKTFQDISQVLNAVSGSDDYLDRVKDPEAQNIEPPLYINSLNKVSSYPIPRQRIHKLSPGSLRS